MAGRTCGVLALAALLANGCRPVPTPSEAEPGNLTTQPDAGTVSFSDVAAAAGIEIHNLCGTETKPHIVESMGAGGCWLDFDRDGWLDLFVVQSSTYPEFMPSPAPHDVLYRSNGDGTFDDVTAASGIVESAWGGGCAIADIDADGWPDIYVTNHGSNVMWRNRGNSTFEDVTSVAGVGDDRWGASATFGDFDKDGDPDLFVANYVTYDWENPPVNGGADFCTWHGIEVFCGPRGMILTPPVYYANQGDGTFVDQTSRAGFTTAEATYGLGVVTLDYNRDGWTDLYMANDARSNHLWQNLGDGTFKEVSFSLGAGLSDRGKEQAGMGVDAGDYDNDGWPDIFVTNFSEDTYSLYHNQRSFFDDASFDAGITRPTYAMLGWAAKFFDYDNDADLDLLAVNGHVFPQVSEYTSRPPVTWSQRANMLENRDGKFVDVAEISGPGLAREYTGRGAAIADYDNDGDLDIALINLDAQASLLRNNGGPGHRWLGVELSGRASNRDGLGAVLTVRAEGLRM